MPGLGLAILSGLLGGLGATGGAIASARKEALERRDRELADRRLEQQLAIASAQLAEQRRQFDEGRFTTVPFEALPADFRKGFTADVEGRVQVPTAQITPLMTARGKELEEERSLRRGGALAQDLETMFAEPRPVPGETPESGALIRSLPREIQTIVSQYRTLGDRPELTKELMAYLYPKPTVIGPGSGAYVPGQGIVATQPLEPKITPHLQPGLHPETGQPTVHNIRTDRQGNVVSAGPVPGVTPRPTAGHEAEARAAAMLADKGWHPTMPGYATAFYDALRQVQMVPPGGAAYRPSDVLIPPPPTTGATPRPAGAPAAPAVERVPTPETAAHYIHKSTLEPPPSEWTLTAIQQSGQYAAVPIAAVNKLGNVRMAKAMVESIERVIQKRPDLFPPLTGKAVIDAKNVSLARVKWEAVSNRLSPSYGTDPDAAEFQSNVAALPSIVRSFGDVGNIAAVEQKIQGEALGLSGPAGREAAQARVDNIKRLINNGLQGLGLNPFLGPGPSATKLPPLGEKEQPALHERWERGPDGRLRKVTK